MNKKKNIYCILGPFCIDLFIFNIILNCSFNNPRFFVIGLGIFIQIVYFWLGHQFHLCIKLITQSQMKVTCKI